jgi:hypothetical protein
MDENEWLMSNDPQAMLRWLWQETLASDRKLRLFACACCRTESKMLVEEGLDAIDVCENYACGLVDEVAVKAARIAAKPANLSPANASFVAQNPEAQKALAAVATLCWGRIDSWRGATQVLEQILDIRPFTKRNQTPKELATILRDLLGPLPFRVVSIAPSCLAWNARTVAKLAESITTERAFEQMPVLADALEDAGCSDATILDYCREDVYVRGCYVLDLCLGLS